MKLPSVVLRLVLAVVLCAGTAGAVRAAVVINEIMYNSIETTDVEYVEIYNTGPSAQSLSGWYLIDSDSTHTKCFLVGTLNVGAYLVIPGFTSTFTAKYPGVTNLNANQFDSTTPGVGFSLGNGGDTARVFNNIGVLIEHPHFLKIQSVMLRALGPHPDARADVVKALRQMDEENAPVTAAGKVIDHVAA
jgi:hypothetical protein